MRMVGRRHPDEPGMKLLTNCHPANRTRVGVGQSEGIQLGLT